MGIDQPDGDDGLAHARDLSGAPASRQPRDAGDTFHATAGPEDVTVASEKTAAGPEAAGAVSEEAAVVSEETAAGPDGNEDQDRAKTSDAGAERQVRIDRVTEHRATVDAAYRAYAIDQAYEKISEIERGTVTPAMRRIEAEDPDRHLAGLENRLKGRDRLAEKVNFDVQKKGVTVDQAVGSVKDAVRYTFCYSVDAYTVGVYADCDRLAHSGFELVELRNSWEKEQYKGINSRWQVPANGQVFELQFHTQASLDAKEETHWAYEKLRVGVPTPAEQYELEEYQARITARVPIPPGAQDIPDYP